jgi:hypothetical protein
MLPVIIFGGIFSGVFTANEAAVVACVVRLYRGASSFTATMKFKPGLKVTVNSAVTIATLLIIVAGATCFGRYLTLRGIPMMITEPWSPDPAALDIPAGHEYHPAGGGHVHGHHFRHPDPDANLPAHAALGQHQCAALRPAHDREPGHRILHPAPGRVPVHHRRPGQPGFVFVSKAVMPWIAIQIAVLLMMTYLPDTVLWLPRLVGWDVD